jgi:hypothetical protein
VDFIELAPRDVTDAVMLLAQRGGPLSRRHLIYLDRVGVAAVPESNSSGGGQKHAQENLEKSSR